MATGSINSLIVIKSYERLESFYLRQLDTYFLASIANISLVVSTDSIVISYKLGE